MPALTFSPEGGRPRPAATPARSIHGLDDTLTTGRNARSLSLVNENGA
jgi:hypothetical protein